MAPGGTENVDAEIYEAVVTQPIVEPQVSFLRGSLTSCFLLVGDYQLFLAFSPVNASTRARST